MDHNTKKHKQGSALLISILFLSIVLTLILTAQIVIIRQNYEAVYDDGRAEQASYNSLANIANAIWNYVTTKTVALPGEYSNPNINLIATTDDENKTVDILSEAGDSKRQIQAELGTKLEPIQHYANIVVMIDQSGSMAIDNFTASEYVQCLQGSINNCNCLIPQLDSNPVLDNKPTCQPFRSVLEAAGTLDPTPTPTTPNTLLSVFNQPVSNPQGSIQYKHDLINKLTYIISPVHTPFSSTLASNISDYDGTSTQLEDFIRLNYLYPSNNSYLAHVVNDVTSNSATYYEDNSSGHYNFLILMTDGSPNITPGTPDIVCNTNYQGGNLNVCIDTRNYIVNKLIDQNTNQTKICTLTIGYGNLLSNDTSKNSASALDFVTSQLANTNINDSCPVNLDLNDVADDIQHYRIVSNPSDVGEALKDIANRITENLNSITIDRITPNQ